MERCRIYLLISGISGIPGMPLLARNQQVGNSGNPGIPEFPKPRFVQAPRAFPRLSTRLSRPLTLSTTLFHTFFLFSYALSTFFTLNSSFPRSGASIPLPENGEFLSKSEEERGKGSRKVWKRVSVRRKVAREGEERCGGGRKKGESGVPGNSGIPGIPEIPECWKSG